MAEQTILDEGGVTVTSARFIVPAQTYAMNGITSVKSIEHRPSIKIPIILIIIGLVLLQDGETAIGLILMIIGIVWIVLNKTRYSVILCSSSGEAEALTSEDSDYISRVVGALNEAIVVRG